MCACAFDLFTAGFSHPGTPPPPPRATYFSLAFSSSLRICPECTGNMRQRGCAVLSQLASPWCVSRHRQQTRAIHYVMWQWLQREQGRCVCVCALRLPHSSTGSWTAVLWLPGKALCRVFHLGSWTITPERIEKCPATPSYC